MAKSPAAASAGIEAHTSESTSDLVKANNGRTYRQNPDGRLSEVYVAKDHAERLLNGISPDHTITGLRVSNSKDPNAPAVVVTFTPEEGATVLNAVREVLEDRTEA